MFQKDTNPKTARQMLPAVLSGILASLCWIIGDLLIVGFTPAPEKYPLLSETYASQIDVGLATLMLSGSTNRLMWGALMAVFSVPFYLYSTFAVSRLIKRKFMMPVFLLLLLGFAYAPLGHAAFFYVGEIYKAVINTDVSAHAQLLQTAAGFVRILKICWTVSAGFTAVGWLVFGIMVASGKTLLKRNAVWLNPIMFFIGIALLSLLLPSPLKDRIGCAIFNEAHLVFFATLLFIVLRKRHSANARTVSNLNKQRGNGRKKLIDNGIKGWLSEQYQSVKKTTVRFPDFVNPRYLTGDNRK